MPTSLRFYCGVLRFEIHQQAVEGWVWLKRPGIDLMLNTAYESDSRPPEPDPARVAAHGDTALFFGCEDLDALYAHLQAAGLAVPPPKVAPYGMRQLNLRDPDGYGLCFQWPV